MANPDPDPDPAPGPDADDALPADDPALLAQMGFAAFGTQPPDRARPAAKKRRPNPPHASPASASATSANRQPLGARRAPADTSVAPAAGAAHPTSGPPAPTVPAPDDPPPAAEARAADGTALGAGQEPRDVAGDGELRPVRREDRGAAEWAALRKGVRDEQGDVAYFDWSFVEDPWEGLGSGGGRGGLGGEA